MVKCNGVSLFNEFGKDCAEIVVSVVFGVEVDDVDYFVSEFGL